MREKDYLMDVFREEWHVSLITLIFIPLLIWVAKLPWFWSILLGALFSIHFTFIAYLPTAIEIKLKAFRDEIERKSILIEDIRIPLEPSKFVEFEMILKKVNSYYKTVNYISAATWFASGNFLVFLSQQAQLIRAGKEVTRIFIWNKYSYGSEMAKRLLYMNIYLGVKTRILPRENLVQILTATNNRIKEKAKDIEFFLYDTKENDTIQHKGCYGKKENNKEEITPISSDYDTYAELFTLIFSNSKEVCIENVRDIENFIKTNF